VAAALMNLGFGGSPSGSAPVVTDGIPENLPFQTWRHVHGPVTSALAALVAVVLVRWPGASGG
jgi:hypothetical protein